jgi:ketosteroid isomerase-like protein
MDGKTEKMPSPIRAASVWVRDGNTWKAAYHSETMIIDPKNPPPAPPASEKKEEPKKEEAANSNTASEPAKPAAGANTEALTKLHQAGWDAFKAKDAKWFNEHLSSDFALVDPLGNWTGSKADAVKAWTETMKCEGITTATVTDGVATAISPTVEILTLKGTADGTCDGQKNGPLYQTAVYVKEGDSWKLAFMFESPAMS